MSPGVATNGDVAALSDHDALIRYLSDWVYFFKIHWSLGQVKQEQLLF